MIKGKLYYFRYAAILFRKQHYVSSQHRANMELLCKVELLICYSHCITVALRARFTWPLVPGSDFEYLLVTVKGRYSGNVPSFDRA